MAGIPASKTSLDAATAREQRVRITDGRRVCRPPGRRGRQDVLDAQTLLLQGAAALLDRSRGSQLTATKKGSN
jgi:hypothetical protein